MCLGVYNLELASRLLRIEAQSTMADEDMRELEKSLSKHIVMEKDDITEVQE